MSIRWIAIAACLFVSFAAWGESPSVPVVKDWIDWPMGWAPGAPGLMAADALLDKPAGKLGPVVARDGHFFTGDRRFRMWGVNFAFSACFPTHEQADGVAARLSRHGINAVRLHHMDAQPFPAGIFTDKTGEQLSADALDRLDYLVAALKREGVYVDLNLHVSRTWSKAHHWENADQLPENDDKIIDLFHPDLIAANQKYARDLLTHVNAYTKTRYADEPAVAVVEINNEDTLFLWGGEGAIARLPEPYAGMLKKRWNEWLAKKYPSRGDLKKAWAVDEQPLGPNLLPDDFAKLGKAEQHESVKVTSTAAQLADGSPAVALAVTGVDGTEWHGQYTLSGLKLVSGKAYTVTFTAKSEKATSITASAAQAHAPWKNMGLAAPVKLKGTERAVSLGFTANEDDDNARLSFAVGRDVTAITLGKIELREGGRLGLRDEEDAGQSTVASHAPGRSDTRARTVDWFDFLQQTDEAYFVAQREFLKSELGVKCPITGTIGLGPLGTLSQSKMDFVDAHAYWDHPSFPHRPWDPADWVIKNEPMVDAPEKSPLWGLAATRVAGKPFTVTEYNHAAPNEWQAECVPVIAAYAALQDWDGVFLFAYSHNDQFDKGKTASYFDIEGNPLKMPFMPLAARLFLGGAVQPFPPYTIHANRQAMLETGSQYYFQMWPFVRDVMSLPWQEAASRSLSFALDSAPANASSEQKARTDHPLQWQGDAPGTSLMTISDPHFAAAVGFFSAPIPTRLGPLQLSASETPFASLLLVPADTAKTFETADRLLLVAVGRAQNSGAKWDQGHHTLSNHWGNAPMQIEPVRGMLTMPGPAKWKVIPLKPDGTADAPLPPVAGEIGQSVNLSRGNSLWYVLERER